MLAPTAMAALIFDSPMDIMVVVLIALVLFGGKKIPEVMRGLGSGIREFKEGMRDEPRVATPVQSAQAAPPSATLPPTHLEAEKK